MQTAEWKILQPTNEIILANDPPGPHLGAFAMRPELHEATWKDSNRTVEMYFTIVLQRMMENEEVFKLNPAKLIKDWADHFDDAELHLT